VVFLPALWIQALYANPLWGAVVGLFYVVGRFIYRAEYLKDPSTRDVGFTMTIVPSIILLVWGLVAAVLRMV
jgi:glutathione S-transferase